MTLDDTTPSTTTAAAEGDLVTILFAGQYPVDGTIRHLFPEERSVHVLTNSPRGRWGVIVAESWLVRARDRWELQLP